MRLQIMNRDSFNLSPSTQTSVRKEEKIVGDDDDTKLLNIKTIASGEFPLSFVISKTAIQQENHLRRL